MSTNKARLIVRVMPSAQDAMTLASRAIQNGALSSSDAQALERCVNGNKVIPADLLYRVKKGASK
ncbi:hypothetical protein GNZ12_24215 [Paraburkholderia sp. 1N]|uniref:Antitoxin VbhA domain-containing protein n=1 Tax=Paraburkholderia solitsugae TaxID=2675748 RepID=A0ABX2BUF3_9BURK|nr:hypothetical protein [Paraburkholderia solitsugae]NPT44359.1 hypothetical protein [Paraburkholderia solitsugae]